MIKVKCLYFSFLREQLGLSEEMVSVPLNATVLHLLDELIETKNLNSKLKSLLRVAVNEEYTDFNIILKEGDEVVFIPPVAGG